MGAPTKIEVSIKNYGSSSVTVDLNIQTGTGISGSGCEAYITGPIEGASDSITISAGATVNKIYLLTDGLYSPGTIYALIKVGNFDTGECYDGEYTSYVY